MKNIVRAFLLICVTLSTPLLQGCGSNKDEGRQKANPASASPQTIVEQKAARLVEIGEPAPQLTEQAGAEGMQPDAQEPEKELSAENKPTMPQTAGTPGIVEIKPSAEAIVEAITIENQGYASDKKGPVRLSHIKHSKEYGVSCTQCHHLYKDGKNLWKEGDKVDKCVVCHDPLEDKDKTVKLQSAFHKNCRDCHSEVNKDGKEAPSAKCIECHG